MRQLVKQIKQSYSRNGETKGFCKHKFPIMIGDDGVRCVICKRLVEFTIPELEQGGEKK